MSDISIVTAFFDIGRGEWTPDKGLPHYLHRTTDTYFERFANMAKLDNQMTVFTSTEFVDRVKEIRGDKPTTVIELDFNNSFVQFRDKVREIQTSEEYLSKINPSQVKNPEYWNPDYVIVNALKSTFVNQAILNDSVHSDLVAWLDFGYCRDSSVLNGVTDWKYDFDPEKIHLFSIKDFVEGTYIQDIIANNDVHITGPCIVAGKDKWRIMESLIHHSLVELTNNNLIDDDQTLLLMSYLLAPEHFEIHKVSDNDWFVAFKEFSL